MTRKAAFGSASMALAAVASLGAAIRLGYNSVLRYGNGDEYHYRLQVQSLYESGWGSFPALVRAHLESEPNFPAPYRWGYLACCRLACAIRHLCDERSLAWVSTLSGIAVVALVALLGAKLFGNKAALVATALTATSPLHLELGRRAYADELHTACLLLAVLAFAYLAVDLGGRRRWAWTSLALLSLTMSWSVKESTAFFLPALGIGLFWLRRPSRFGCGDTSFLFVPPLVAVACFAWLNQGLSPLLDLLRATRQSFFGLYSSLNQYGPPHRPLIELFTLAPAVFGLLPIAALAAFSETFRDSTRRDRGDEGRAGTARSAQALALTFALIVVVFLLLPKNIRFYSVLDPIAALLVAWCVCEVIPGGKTLSAGWWAAILFGHAAFELALFHRAFVTSVVTDPTANAIFRALEMVPGDTVARRWHPPGLVVSCSLLSVTFAWIAAYRAKFKRRTVVAAIALSVCALGFPQLFRPFRTVMGAVTAQPQGGWQ